MLGSAGRYRSVDSGTKALSSDRNTIRPMRPRRLCSDDLSFGGASPIVSTCERNRSDHHRSRGGHRSMRSRIYVAQALLQECSRAVLPVCPNGGRRGGTRVLSRAHACVPRFAGSEDRERSTSGDSSHDSTFHWREDLWSNDARRARGLWLALHGCCSLSLASLALLLAALTLTACGSSGSGGSGGEDGDTTTTTGSSPRASSILKAQMR